MFILILKQGRLIQKLNMKIKANLIKYITVIMLIVSPLFVVGQTGIIDIIVIFSGILRYIINFLMILATVIFLWGVITYITAGGVEDKIREEIEDKNRE